MYAVQINFTGKKSKAGNICFDAGHLGVFVDYCNHCHSKIIMDIQEAEQFANKYVYETSKRKNRQFLQEVNKRS